MSQLILARGNDYRKSILKRILPNVELGPYFLIVSLVIFVILVTVITLMFSTRQVTKGYVLNSLESKNQDLIRQSEVADMQLSKVKSLNYIQETSKVRKMVKPDQLVYVTSDSTIASK